MAETRASERAGSASKIAEHPAASLHYAWARDTEQRRQELAAMGVDTTPRPVAAPAQEPISGGAGSAWNKAGTW
jgi:hypothetical protein